MSLSLHCIKRILEQGVHYQSIPEHPYYRKAFGWRPRDYPNSNLIGKQTVSIPFSSKLSDNDVDDVVRTIEKVLKRYG